MSGKIRCGAPGSYKTSTAVLDELCNWAQQGRVVVTNVRGIKNKSFKKAYKNDVTFLEKILPRFFKRPPIKKGFRIIDIDTDTEEGRHQMRTWFMWAPLGCAFLIDEVQMIYPQKWTPADYKKLCFSNIDEAKLLGRPEDVYIAFEKHRHYNWDFVVTAPNIRKVPEIFKQIAEVSYHHDNRGKSGLRGWFEEYMHEPSDTYKSAYSRRLRRKPTRAFCLYESTTTGAVKDTEAGRNLFLQPKVIFVLLFVSVWGTYSALYLNPFDGIFFNEEQELDYVESEEAKEIYQQIIDHSEADPLLDKPLENPPANLIKDRNTTRSIRLNSDVRPLDFGRLEQYKIHIGGDIAGRFVYITDTDGSTSEVDQVILAQLGYSIQPITNCFWTLTHHSVSRDIHCWSEPIKEKGNSLLSLK